MSHTVLALTLWMLVPLAAQPPSAPLSRMDRERGRAMLKQLREDIEKHYYDPGFRGVDLGAKFEAAGAMVDKAGSLNEMYAILTDAAMQLDDSHTSFIPPDRNARVAYGWRMKIVGEAALVDSVTPGTDAQAKGLAPGDRVLALNRFQPDRGNLWRISYLYRVVRPQATQRLVIRKPDGSERMLDVNSKIVNTRFAQLSDMILEAEAADREMAQRSQPVGSDILVWRMPAFGDMKPAEAVIKKARAYTALVIDLRDNGGGLVDTMNTMVSWVFDREVFVGTEKTRKGEETYRAKPKKEPFRGRLIVLVDSNTGSAAEMFARVVQIEKRGTVIGDRTAGAVMTGRLYRAKSSHPLRPRPPSAALVPKGSEDGTLPRFPCSGPPSDA